MAGKTIPEEFTNEIEGLGDYLSTNFANLTENYSSAITDTLTSPIVQFDNYVEQIVDWLVPLGFAAMVPFILVVTGLVGLFAFVFVRLAYFTPYNQTLGPVFGDVISQKIGNVEFKDLDFIWKIVQAIDKEVSKVQKPVTKPAKKKQRQPKNED